jgi:hypothetical protein
MREERGPWYIITGLILGLAMGLGYAWLIQPMQYTETSPAALRADFKGNYRTLIALAYASNGDLVRARARLELLQDENVTQLLAEQAQRKLADGSPQNEARALSLLAVALGKVPPTVALQSTPELSMTPDKESTITPEVTPTNSPAAAEQGSSSDTTEITDTLALASTMSASLVPTRTPNPTNTPLPTWTPTPTRRSPYTLQSQEFVCEEEFDRPLIQIEVQDAAEQPVSGIEAIVNWDGGENHFFTGLKPDLGLGYADFVMTPGVVYTLRLAAGSELIPDLATSECEDQENNRYWGTWRFLFTQS